MIVDRPEHENGGPMENWPYVLAAEFLIWIKPFIVMNGNGRHHNGQRMSLRQKRNTVEKEQPLKRCLNRLD